MALGRLEKGKQNRDEGDLESALDLIPDEIINLNHKLWPALMW